MIELTQAGYAYARDAWVFRNYSLRVERGDVLAILGPNGRGKTTLLKSLLGLVRLQEGRVHVATAAGYVPQMTRTVFPYTVLDMVLMGRARQVHWWSAPTRRDVAHAEAVLERLGLTELAERSFDALSGGQRQLVLVARALAAGCELLVLDEPTSALDFNNQQRMLQVLRTLAQEGITVVFTSHAPGHAELVATHALLMFDVADYRVGPVREVMTEADLTRLYQVPMRRVAVPDAPEGYGAVVPVLT